MINDRKYIVITDDNKITMNDDIKSNDRIGVGTRLLLRSIAIGERVRFFTENSHFTLP